MKFYLRARILLHNAKYILCARIKWFERKRPFVIETTFWFFFEGVNFNLEWVEISAYFFGDLATQFTSNNVIVCTTLNPLSEKFKIPGSFFSLFTKVGN